MTAQETYYGTREFQNCAWIEPIYGIHDDEQLSWIPLQTEKAVDLFVS
jgi:hypothetical protein